MSGRPVSSPVMNGAESAPATATARNRNSPSSCVASAAIASATSPPRRARPPMGRCPVAALPPTPRPRSFRERARAARCHNVARPFRRNCSPAAATQAVATAPAATRTSGDSNPRWTAQTTSVPTPSRMTNAAARSVPYRPTHDSTASTVSPLREERRVPAGGPLTRRSSLDSDWTPALAAGSRRRADESPRACAGARCAARARVARPARRAVPRSPPRARQDVLRRCPNAASRHLHRRSSSGEVSPRADVREARGTWGQTRDSDSKRVDERITPLSMSRFSLSRSSWICRSGSSSVKCVSIAPSRPAGGS